MRIIEDVEQFRESLSHWLSSEHYRTDLSNIYMGIVNLSWQVQEYSVPETEEEWSVVSHMLVSRTLGTVERDPRIVNTYLYCIEDLKSYLNP